MLLHLFLTLRYQSNQSKQKQPQTIALDQVADSPVEIAAEPTPTTVVPKVSSRGTDFWDVGFGSDQKKGLHLSMLLFLTLFLTNY